jgi:hypothetical protein
LKYKFLSGIIETSPLYLNSTVYNFGSLFNLLF